MTALGLLSCAFLAACIAQAAAAFDPVLPPNSRPLFDRDSTPDTYNLPIGPVEGAEPPHITLDGRVTWRTWAISSRATTLQILSPLLDQVEAAGYDSVFQCRDSDCGGFDFRFAIDVVPAPDMYVDIRNFRFASAMRGRDEAVSILVSGGRQDLYLQIVSVRPAQSGTALRDALDTTGRFAIAGIDLSGENPVFDAAADAALSALADYLAAFPDRRIALVGHGADGGSVAEGRDAAIAWAEATRQRLIDRFGADPSRVIAETVGPLAPIRSPVLPDAADRNRRVTAVLLP